MFEIQNLDHVAISVKDLEKSVKWYQEVLGLKSFRVKEWGPWPVFMMTNNKSGLALFPSEKGNPLHMSQDRKSGLLHIAFKVDQSNFEQAQSMLTEKGIPFDFQDHHNSHSIYFRDPNDYCIELTTYL